MTIPTARDINPFPQNLDGQYAESHFLGRTVDEVFDLFCERPGSFEQTYEEDLLFMGVVAFKYYVPAAIRYANSDARRYDCQTARILLGLLSHRWHDEREQLSDLRELFRGYCLGVLSRIEQMERVWPPDYRLDRQLRRFLAELDNA